MLILAFDPGESTGWCRVDTTAGSICGGSFPLWRGVSQHLLFPAPYPPGWRPGPDVLLVERFLLYPSAASRLIWDKLHTVEVIGVIKYLAEQLDIKVTMQNASVAKSIELAKKPDGFDKHALDALRHILAFLKRERLLTDQLKEYMA